MFVLIALLGLSTATSQLQVSAKVEYSAQVSVGTSVGTTTVASQANPQFLPIERVVFDGRKYDIITVLF